MLKENLINQIVNNFLEKAKNSDGSIDNALKAFKIDKNTLLSGLNYLKNTSGGQEIIQKYNIPINAMIAIVGGDNINNTNYNNSNVNIEAHSESRFPELDIYK